LAADLDGECEGLVTNGVLPADLTRPPQPPGPPPSPACPGAPSISPALSRQGRPGALCVLARAEIAEHFRGADFHKKVQSGAALSR
jgi:hypothetical protein